MRDRERVREREREREKERERERSNKREPQRHKSRTTLFKQTRLHANFKVPVNHYSGYSAVGSA